MKRYRFELVLAVVFTTIFLIFSHMQSPGDKLTAEEIDYYLDRIKQNAPLPEQEKADLVAHFKAWAESDDGRPVYNLNLMRYFSQLRELPGVKLDVLTVAEANSKYEEEVMPLLIDRQIYPVFSGDVQTVMEGQNRSTNLITYDPLLDDWDRVLVVRYPSRKSFLDLISDPRYLKIMPYKLSSLLVVLTPVSGELVVPELHYILGSVLASLFLLVGWIRSEWKRRQVLIKV